MRTLALLATVLLLALLAQAESLPGRADQAEPELQEEDEDQVTILPFREEEGSALPDAGVAPGLTCYCRSSCRSREQTRGICRIGNRIYRFCCR